ncbi:MAG: peptidylprolyl isomerase [Acetobacteraceae bacterium]|nr:peptidylprolyl isomerase [Acetobacteraceae bacterium]
MRFRSLILAATLLVPVAALAQAAPPAPAAEDPVVAKVDGEELRLSDVAATASDLLPQQLRNVPPAALMQMLPPEVSRQLVDRAITERALVIAARSAGLDKDEEVRRRIRRAEEQELQQALLSREVNTQVTEQAVRARYDQEAARRQGEEEIHARHILVQTETEARAAMAEIKGGADFAEVAKRLSKDPGSRDSGGDLGFFKKGDMVPEFAEAAFAMQPGQISSAPVRTPFGWHIIKVEERRTAPVPSFEESRQEIERKLLEEQVNATVRRIRAAAKVERFDQAPATGGGPGGSLLDNASPPPAPAPQPR